MANTYARMAGPAHRTHRSAVAARALAAASQHLLLLVATGVFIVAASTLIVSQVWSAVEAHSIALPATAVSPARSATSAATAASADAVPTLSAAQIQEVLSYAQTMRDNDSLVQVRPSVFGKRSNVEGIKMDGQTVYYAVTPHQSFDPLATGKLKESDVTIQAREAVGGALIVVYTHR